MPRQPLEGAELLGRLEVDPADDTGDLRDLLGDAQQIVALGDGRRGLHQHGLCDPRRLELRGEVGGAVDTPEKRVGVLQPAIVSPRRIPKVLVRVDEVGHAVMCPFGTGAAASTRPLDFRSAQRAGGIVARAAAMLPSISDRP